MAIRRSLETADKTKAISVSFPLKYGGNGGVKFTTKCAAQELVKCMRDIFTDIIENPSVEVVRIFKSAGTKNEDWRICKIYV